MDKIEKSIFHQLVSRDRLFLFSFFICAGLTIAGGWVGGNLYLNGRDKNEVMINAEGKEVFR